MKQSISKKWKTWLVAVVVILLCAVMCFTFAACGSGEAPYIGDDGYWYVNGQKTDTLAQGPAGPAGPQGPQGEPGASGGVDQPGAGGDDVDLPDITESTVTPVGSTTGHLENDGKFYLDYETVEEEQ